MGEGLWGTYSEISSLGPLKAPHLPSYLLRVSLQTTLGVGTLFFFWWSTHGGRTYFPRHHQWVFWIVYDELFGLSTMSFFWYGTKFTLSMFSPSMWDFFHRFGHFSFLLIFVFLLFLYFFIPCISVLRRPSSHSLLLVLFKNRVLKVFLDYTNLTHCVILITRFPYFLYVTGNFFLQSSMFLTFPNYCGYYEVRKFLLQDLLHNNEYSDLRLHSLVLPSCPLLTVGPLASGPSIGVRGSIAAFPTVTRARRRSVSTLWVERQ